MIAEQRAGDGTSPDDVCARAEALAARWSERAPITESAGRIAPETITELFSAGLLQLLTPREYGGLELDWATLVEASRIAARACASTGWTIAVIGGHAALAARLPEHLQQMIFADGPEQFICTAAATTTGTIERHPNGFRVNGLWRFSSGVDHARWAILNGKCADDQDGDTVFLVARRSEFRIEDGWDLIGMKGTGSRNIRFDRTVVPSDRVSSLPRCFAARPKDGRRSSRGYLYEVPFQPYISTVVVGPILGCAEGAYRQFLRSAKDGLGNAQGGTRSVIAERVAESSAELRCAELLFESIAETLQRAGAERRGVSDLDLSIVRRDCAYLAHLCLQAIERLVRHHGTSGWLQADPLQRHWRDLQVMTSHRGVSWDSAMNAFDGTAVPVPLQRRVGNK